MCKTPLFLIAFFPVLLFGQTVDSSAIKTMDSLILVSRGLTGKGDFDNALKVSAEAEKMALEKWGMESAKYASACFNRGRVLYYKGDYPEAEKWYLDAKAIQEKVLGTENADYAWSLNNLGVLYWRMGSFEKAEQMHWASKTIRAQVLGKFHPDYASSLSNLGIVNQDLGNYEKSEAFHLEALATGVQIYGKESPKYAVNLNNLAALYATMGDYEKAEPITLEAKNYIEKSFGKESNEYAWSAGNLAGIYALTGQYKKAELLFKEVLEIKALLAGADSLEYAKGLYNLASLYYRTDDYKKAEAFNLEAFAIRKKNLPKEHPDYARSLNSLAGVYTETGKLDHALELLLEAQSIREQSIGKLHLDYAIGLNHLGGLYEKMKAYPKAQKAYLEALDISEQLVGAEYPDATGILDELAWINWSTGDFEASQKYLLKARSLERNLLIKATHYLSEREIPQMAISYATHLDRDFSFALVEPKMAASCFDNILFHKGYLLNAVAQVKKLAQKDSITSDQYLKLKSLHRLIAAEYSKPISERENVVLLEEKANSIEKDLARKVAGFGEALRQVSWLEVQQKLKPGEAAIEFVHYKFMNPFPTDTTLYAAMVLIPGSEAPVFIPLCTEKVLDVLLHAKGKSLSGNLNNLYNAPDLYTSIWQPIEKRLSGIHTIYYSPSGLLHRLNLDAMALPAVLGINPPYKTLADQYQLIKLGSTRQLVLLPDGKTVNQNAVLYGGIHYSMDSSKIARSNVDISSMATRGNFDFSEIDSTLRGNGWEDLKWTEIEVRATEAILTDAGLQSAIFSGYAATEEAFKTIGSKKPSPRILHIATHGFFFPDPKRKAQAVMSNELEPVFKMSDHPMIRSGLILAGGNHSWKTGLPIQPGMEDGILTAYEISQMNLSNTELVVLSACETGLGDIQGNEGVYGLQRAFKIAGAKYLIMSLWQVPDFQTQELMTTFYSRWMEDKMTVPEAFRSAQKAMREKYKDPFLWAGFVLVE